MPFIPPEELEHWLQQARDAGKPIDMSVSCPVCWLPMLLDGSGDAEEGGCQCGTVATLEELKRAFGIEGSSGSFHGIQARD